MPWGMPVILGLQWMPYRDPILLAVIQRDTPELGIINKSNNFLHSVPIFY